MKPYGLKRKLCFKYPDKSDCLETGASSKFMKMAGKNRQASRRVFAKLERRSAIKAIEKEIFNFT